MKGEKIENIEEVEIEVLDTYNEPEESEETESSKSVSGKLIAGGLAVLGFGLYLLHSTKDKRAVKREKKENERDEKEKQRLISRGYDVKKIEEINSSESAEDVEKAVPEENKQ